MEKIERIKPAKKTKEKEDAFNETEAAISDRTSKEFEVLEIYQQFR